MGSRSRREGTPDERPRARHELARLLSKAGLASRTQAAEWIRAGRVRVDGDLVRNPRLWCDPLHHVIELDGAKITLARKLYYALHKPRGYMTTRADPRGRKTVYELLIGVDAWVAPVGRLDLDTSGLLLFTNDTDFADSITDPRFHVEKQYKVECTPRLDETALARLRDGLVLDDGPTQPAEVELLGHRGPATRFTLTIREGRNRQVRRMVQAVGSQVEKLARVRIGPLELGELAAGEWRALQEREVRALADAGGRARG